MHLIFVCVEGAHGGSIFGVSIGIRALCLPRANRKLAARSVRKCSCFDWWWRSGCHAGESRFAHAWQRENPQPLHAPITDNSKVRSRQHKDGRSHLTLPARQRDLLQSKSRFIAVQTSQFSHYQVSNKTSISSNMVKPGTCCGKGDNCVCAQQATCSCGQQSAMNCTCDKKATENTVTGPRCSCR